MTPQALDFCKFRIPQSGRRVIWEITNECNYGCKYCIFASTGRKPLGELSLEQAKSVLNELSAQGFTYIKYTGGEPFLRSDMTAILAHTTSLGLECDISTNASRITQDTARELAHLTSMVHVSLDGHTREIHEAVRGKKSFNPTLEGLKHLTQHHPHVRIGCVIHAFNETSLGRMVDFCRDLNVHELVFSLMEPVGRLRDKTYGLSERPVQEIAHEINAYAKRESAHLRISHNLLSSPSISSIITVHDKKPLPPALSLQPCPGGEKFIFINSTGRVSPCTWVSEKMPWRHDDNLHDLALADILQNLKNFSSLARQMPGQCPAVHVRQFNDMERIHGSQV